jgi:hypothetical protein
LIREVAFPAAGMMGAKLAHLNGLNGIRRRAVEQAAQLELARFLMERPEFADGHLLALISLAPTLRWQG